MKILFYIVLTLIFNFNAFGLSFNVTPKGRVSESKKFRNTIVEEKWRAFWLSNGGTINEWTEGLYASANSKMYYIKTIFDKNDLDKVYHLRILTIARSQDRSLKIPYSPMRKPITISLDPNKAFNSGGEIVVVTPKCYGESGTGRFHGKERGWITNGVIIELVCDGKVRRTWYDNGASKGRSTIENFLSWSKTECPNTENQYAVFEIKGTESGYINSVDNVDN